MTGLRVGLGRGSDGVRHSRPLRCTEPAPERVGEATVEYSGRLAAEGRELVLHAGFDGWLEPHDLPMEREDDSTWTALVPETEEHVVLDCVVKDGDETDNNDAVDYRLWLHLDPVDSHVHARVKGNEPMGFASLTTAFFSSGMTHALISWQDNAFVDRVSRDVPWLSRLVWVRPGRTRVEDLRRRLSSGSVGLKLHPAYDNFPADTPALDPYLEEAEEADVPVTVHSGPAFADPDLIRRLAERFPKVRFVLYHTYLGPEEGRERAARHAHELPNLYLETSWCRSSAVEHFVEVAGPDRVLFGSDAAIDGAWHYNRNPPNIEMVENYNQGVLLLVQRLGAEVGQRLLEDNARELFRIPAAAKASDEGGSYTI
ncbi:MAG: amidohydrolase family protein [Actinomycetes bacterium]